MTSTSWPPLAPPSSNAAPGPLLGVDAWLQLPEDESGELVAGRLEDGHYIKLVGATAGRVDPVPGCAGLVVDLDALWTDLARLSDE